MKPVDQTITGENGNCFAACVASILELPIEQVPNFCNDYPADKWGDEFRKWLEARGLGCVSLRVTQEDWANLALSVPYVPVIAGGHSVRRPHAVVYVGGEMVHDPHPDRGGLVLGSLDTIWLILSERPQPGPQCAGCDEPSKSDAAARAAGWRWGTYHPDPDISACWLCRDCWNGQGSE